MAMNPVQFQPGLSMVEFVEQYGTVARCRRALYRARWPIGFRCLRKTGVRVHSPQSATLSAAGRSSRALLAVKAGFQ